METQRHTPKSRLGELLHQKEEELLLHRKNIPVHVGRIHEASSSKDAFYGRARANAERSRSPRKRVSNTAPSTETAEECPDPAEKVGQLAMIGLMMQVTEQLNWMFNNPIRHGKSTEKSIALQERLQTGNFANHGGKKPVDDTQLQGDKLAFLFKHLLEILAEEGFLKRCGDRPPKMATNVRKFHGKHFREFALSFPIELCEEETDQVLWLQEFLFKYWSTDPEKKAMTPENPQKWRPGKAGWDNFWMTDTELTMFTKAVVQRYRASMSGVKHLGVVTGMDSMKKCLGL